MILKETGAGKVTNNKKYASELRNTLPIVPITVDMRYASLACIYFLKSPKYINLFQEVDELRECIEKYLAEKQIEVLGIEVYNDCVIIQENDPVDKQTWEEETIPIIQELLMNEFDSDIKSIVYA